MKKYLLATTAAGAALAMTVPANAGGYLSIFGGYSMNDQEASARIFQSSGTWTGSYTFSTSSLTSSHYTSNAFGASFYHRHFWGTVSHIDREGSWVSATDVDLKADDGFVIGAATGGEIAPGLRGEVEIAYRKHDVNAKGTWYFSSAYVGTGYALKYSATDIHVHSATTESPYTTSQVLSSGGPNFWTKVPAYTKGGSFTSSTVSGSGDLTAMSIMANVWLDVDLGLGDGINTYVGAGLGYADVTLEMGDVDVSDTAVAFQVGAGVSFDLPKEGHAISLEVRRFVVPKLELMHNGFDIPLDYEVTDIIISYRIAL